MLPASERREQAPPGKPERSHCGLPSREGWDGGIYNGEAGSVRFSCQGVLSDALRVPAPAENPLFRIPPREGNCKKMDGPAEAGLPLQRDKARGKETDEDPVSGCWRRSTGAFARSFWRWPKPSFHGSVKCSGGPEEYCEKKTPAAPVPERERAPRARFSVRRSITDRDAEADQQQHEQEVCEKERQALSDPGEIIHLDH